MRPIQDLMPDRNNKHKMASIVVSNYYENLKKVIDEIDIAYISSNADENKKIKLYQLTVEHKKKAFLDASLGNLTTSKSSIMSFEDKGIIEVSNFETQPEENPTGRLFDILTSVCLLVITSSLMLIIVIPIKVTSLGPVIYK